MIQRMHPRRKVPLPEKKQLQGPSGWEHRLEFRTSLGSRQQGLLTGFCSLQGPAMACLSPWSEKSAGPKWHAKPEPGSLQVLDKASVTQDQKNPLRSQLWALPTWAGRGKEGMDQGWMPNLPTPLCCSTELQEVPNPQFEPRALVFFFFF